jgi:hypothetical protein
VGGACRTRDGEESCIQGFWWRILRKRGHLGDPSVDGKIILIWVFRKWDLVGMDWIELAQDTDRWREFVKVVINLCVP